MASPEAVTVAGSRTPTSLTSGPTPRRSLLDHVVDVGAVQHGQVGVLPGRVGEAAEHRLGHPAQRHLP